MGVLRKITNWYFSKRALPYWAIVLIDCVAIFVSGWLIAILTDGMDATLSEGHEMPVINQTSDINAIAWKRGSFIFEDTPLKEVLECLSRHYNVSFAATDLSKRLNGEFHTDDLDLILDLIESALDVTIVNNTRSACERN
jgi:ferric-dicitrate binding protein FerR (iron transport regulator)